MIKPGNFCIHVDHVAHFILEHRTMLFECKATRWHNTTDTQLTEHTLLNSYDNPGWQSERRMNDQRAWNITRSN